MNYWTFIRRRKRDLAFGFIHGFCSAPGQTFCISLFVTSFAASFQISPTDLGTLYLVATLAAAFALSYLGAWIDRANLRSYSLAAGGLLVSACWLTAAAPNLVVLALGLFALRLAGQGLMSHIQATATARAFTENRGAALGLTGLGIPIATAVFPPLAAFLIAAIGWRWAYVAIGIGVFLLLLTATWWVPRATDFGDSETSAGDAKHHQKPAAAAQVSASRMLMTSGYFWAAIPMLVLAPFVGTALVFQLTVIAADRNWSTAWVAGAFPALALAHIASLFASGRWIDAFSARAVAALHGIPITLGVLVLATFEQPVALVIAMIGMGLTGGAAQTAFAAVWAEVYSLHHFGTIRSLVMSLMVISSAVAPLALGYALSIASDTSIALFLLTALAVGLQFPLFFIELIRIGRARPS